MRSKAIHILSMTIAVMALSAAPGVAQRRMADGPRNGMMRAGVDIGAVGFGSDYTKVSSNYRFRLFGMLNIQYYLSPVFAIGGFAQTGGMAARYQTVDVSNSFFSTGLGTELRWPIARGKVAPYVALRLGGIFFRPRITTDIYETIGEQNSALLYGGGIGIEYIIKRQFGMRLEIGAHLTSSDELDNLVSGPQNDGFSYVSLGASYYFSLGRTSR